MMPPKLRESDRSQSSGKFSDMEAIKQQLKEMANDPDIQREIAEINQEFAIAEMDGLEISQN